jgi:hypothetical protein
LVSSLGLSHIQIPPHPSAAFGSASQFSIIYSQVLSWQ